MVTLLLVLLVLAILIFNKDSCWSSILFAVVMEIREKLFHKQFLWARWEVGWQSTHIICTDNPLKDYEFYSLHNLPNLREKLFIFTIHFQEVRKGLAENKVKVNDGLEEHQEDLHIEEMGGVCVCACVWTSILFNSSTCNFRDKIKNWICLCNVIF